MNIKLVVSDIDGTLIGSDRQIKPVIDEIGNLIKEKKHSIYNGKRTDPCQNWPA